MLDAGRLGTRERMPSDEPLEVGIREARRRPAPRARRAFTEPTSVTTQSPPHSSAARAVAATWLTGAQTKQISAPSSASSMDRAPLVDRAPLERPLERPRIRVPPGHDRALGAPPRGEADRAADQAHAEDGDPGHVVPA